MKKLDGKEQIFVDEYLIDLKPARAGLVAGYAKTTADNKCPAWVKDERCPAPKRHVFEAIKKAMDERSRRTNVSKDMIVKFWAATVFGDIRRIFNEDGQLLKPHEWDDEVAQLVTSVKFTTSQAGEGDVEYVADIRQADKMKASELLAKHLGMFIEKVEIKGNVSINIAPDEDDL